MSIEDIKKKLSSGLVEKLINEPSAHYVHILLLRELQSSAIFTTNGQDADIATVGIGTEDGLVDYSPVMMFKRKQTGSDRRKGKELQRNLTGIEDTMNVNEMTQDSPESMLYGSAAGDEAISVTSRVMYDTAYSIRDSSAIVEEKFQNAPGDQFAKGATTAIREPDFIVPGTVFPCVVTMRDATFDELVFVLGITKMNKRYGAATSRIGRMENHVLGIYCGIEEGPANLILSQEVARRLAMENGGLTSESLNKVLYSPVLDIAKVKGHVKKAFDDDIENLNVEALTDEETEELLGYVTSESLKESLGRQKVLSTQFFQEVNGEKKTRGKK
jgi:CRISPR-associated protein Csc2